MSFKYINKVIGIDGFEISVYDSLVGLTVMNFDVLLKNATLEQDLNGIICIKGDRLSVGFAYSYSKKVFLEDLEKEPDEAHIEIGQGYRSFSDRFNKIKKPYIEKGWYTVKATKLYKVILNKWKIILEQ